jgi:HTH-type transcriptional regulator/antitoxin HigA
MEIKMNAALAEVFPAGEHLADELDARGWTQAEFAEILGRPPQFVSEIISGKKEITRESAAQIGAALGSSTEMWLNLQDSYFLWRQLQSKKTQGDLDDVRLRARLKELAPVSVLRKRGILTETSAQGQAKQLCRLFNINSISEQPQLPMAARRSNHADSVTPTQMTWLACVRQKAEDISVADYSSKRLRILAEGLSHELVNESAFEKLPQLFADVGVRLVYVEAFPSSKLDGASFMLDGTPVIGLSGRGQRFDKVLFTLLHETAHVVLGHVDKHLILDEEGEAQHTLGVEEPANNLAADWILPGGLPPVPARISQGWVESSAAVLEVHPVVLIGRLQNAHLLNWRSALIKGAPNATDFMQTW